MKTFVITLKGNEYSEEKASATITSALLIGDIDIDWYHGIPKDQAREVMEGYGLNWTWANNNKSPAICPFTGLHQRPYYNANLDAKIGCAMSHYELWKKCVEDNEIYCILEHDAVFIRQFPQELKDGNFKGICQINDPKGAGRRGRFLQETMIRNNNPGVNSKTLNDGGPLIPDGLVGNGSYVIKPFAAQELIDKYHELGVWPNDATMCIQLFPYLEEYYPFITKIEQKVSTSST